MCVYEENKNKNKFDFNFKIKYSNDKNVCKINKNKIENKIKLPFQHHTL